MMNKLKYYFTFWIIILAFINANAQQCETIIKFFKDDLYSSTELIAFAEKDPQKAFDSWKVLYNDKTGLAKNIEELNTVSKNLDEIAKVGYTTWKKVNNAGDELTTLLLKSGEDFTILTNARKLPGVSSGIGKDITSTWLRGSEMNAGLFPKSVADKLRGRTFNTFDDFRGAFWKEVANDPNLIKQFTPKDIAIMKNGYAPEVLESQRIGGNIKYVLHHKTPINRGGAVYDVDNLYIVTPKYHKEILDPAYHYGYGY